MEAESAKIPLTLKQKVYLSLGLYMAVILVLGALSFYDLVRIGARVSLLSDYDRLTNVILEARRFEKNYLLYLNEEDLEEARSFITEARMVIADITAAAKWDARLSQLRLTVNDYCASLNSIAEQPPDSRTAAPELTERLRNKGKEMVELAEALSSGEKKGIKDILIMLKLQLILSVVGAILLGAIGMKVLFGKVLNALETVVSATRSIGKGQYETLPDVGEQKELHRISEAFNQMINELEHRQEQLVQAQKLSSLGTLTAGVAHQLNNPLNNISTSAQIALEEIDENDVKLLRRMLGNIEQESSRAREIVQGLLEFSREKGFSPRKVLLADLFEKTLRLVSSQVPSGVDFIIESPDDLTVELDEQRLQEALLNLLINAVQAMPSEYGRVTLRAGLVEPGSEGQDPQESRAPHEPGVFISVQDEGTGMSPDIIQHVFDPFFTTKAERVGTGLGLSIVYGIVERHRGSISVESEQGKGTTITIYLPLIQKEDQGHEHQQDSETTL